MIDDITITATGFTSYLGSVSNIPIANTFYAYDAPDRKFLLFEYDKLIYLVHKFFDSLLNPIQAEEVGVRVDKRPKRYYPNDVGCQSLHFHGDTIIPDLYQGVLPFIPSLLSKKRRSSPLSTIINELPNSLVSIPSQWRILFLVL